MRGELRQRPQKHDGKAERKQHMQKDREQKTEKIMLAAVCLQGFSVKFELRPSNPEA